MLSGTVFPWSPDFPPALLAKDQRPSGHLTRLELVIPGNGAQAECDPGVSALEVNLVQQRGKDRFAFLVRHAVDARWAVMALKGFSYGFGLHIHVGPQAVTEGAQAVGEAHRQAMLSRLRPEADARQRQLAPRKQLAGLLLARRRDVGMAEHAFGRNRMA